ncbi:MAG: SRPBCC family protein [Streptosporangiaceae bacterium]|jgi:carbon monoxide dehydrogenase subunit G
MPRYQATVRSSWSAPDTFNYMATFSNAAQWDPGVTAAEQLDPGPLRVGSRFRLQVKFGGRSMPLTYEITSCDPPHSVVLSAANGLLRSVDRISVTPAGDGATVSYDADVRLRGPLSVLDPLMVKGFQIVAQRAVAGLTQALASAQPSTRS